MTNLEKYNKVFTDVFDLKESSPENEFNSGKKQNWDSIMHLNLVTAIEEEFDIMLDSDDILEFNSYENGQKILSKYNISL